MDNIVIEKDNLMDKWQEDVTLKLWADDESAILDILSKFAIPLEKTLSLRYSSLQHADAEDVVAIAIMKFWYWRQQYDPDKSSIQTVLYRIAHNVALEWVSGRRNWQKAKLYEKGVDPEELEKFQSSITEDKESGKQSKEHIQLLRALNQVISTLPPLHQDIWQAFAEADNYKLNAAKLGAELGHKHNEGVPIPGTTIRGYKSRSKGVIVKEMKKKGFDLKKLGYIND